MYKDVRKKLLSVALCICMVIGALQVVPKVQAADTDTYTKTIKGSVSGAGEKDFEITYVGQTFTYNGSEQKPKLEKVVIKDSTSGDIDVTDKCELTAGNTAAGSYSCYLTGKSASGYSFAQTNTEAIGYKIEKAKIASIKVNYDETKVLKYSKDGVKPEISSLTVTLNDSNRTQLTLTDQYTVTSLTNVGYDQDCTITITGDNFDSTGKMSEAIKCDVAYDLAAASPYYMAFADGGKTSYTGSAITPVLNIYSKDGTVLTKISTSEFTIKYNGEERTALTAAGTYTVEVTPKSGASASCQVGEAIFTGTYTGTYTVGEKTADELIVYSDSADGSKRIALTGASKEELTLPYNGGNSVEPANVVVQDASGNTIGCTISYENSTQAGSAYMLVTPNAGTNYTGTIRIEYFIVSSIHISTIGFTGYNPNVTDLTYSGSAQIPSKVVVVNESGVELTKGDTWHYVITYNYQDEFGNYQATELSEAEAATSTNMASAGTKRIKISGRGKYAGQVYEQEYKIAAVNINSHPDWFSLSLDSDSFYYDGTAKTPGVTFTYKGTYVIPAEEYTVTYQNNVSVGTATVKVTAGSNSDYEGTVSKDFSIRPVAIGNACVINAPFTYDRGVVKPTIAIQNDSVYGAAYSYVLTEDTDYEIEQYMDSTGAVLSGAPVNCGDYTVQIKNLNTGNISGTTKQLSFTITQADINEVTGFQLRGVSGNDREIEWNGGDTQPELIGSALVEGTDYIYEYEDCSGVTAASGASVTITGLGNYTGTKTLTYTITPRSFTSGTDSDFSITASASGNVTDGYQIRLNVTDAARTPESARTLSCYKDYEIKQVEYFEDLTSEWETLTESTDYTRDSSIPGIKELKKAGKYRITIEGKGSYQGTLAVTGACGTDISAYYVGITESGTYVSYPYTGEEIKPSNYILYTSNGNKASVGSDCYQVEYEREDTYSEKLIDVGTIYVVGVGVPEKGYYGRTQIKKDNNKCYYKIIAPKWTAGTYEINVNPEAVTYAPNGGTTIPTVTVSFSGVQLVEGSDYELIYNKSDLQTAGPKAIVVNGIHNYADETNRKTATYVVSKVAIDKTTESHVEASYNGGDPEFSLSYEGYTLVQNTDYTVSKKEDPTTGATIIKESDDKYYLTYIVKGMGNFDGEREIKIQINVSDLSEGVAAFADSAENAQVGEYYVVWTPAECVIPSDQAKLKESERTPVKPSAFTIVYKKSETGTTQLEAGVDYEITGYGKNVTPGVSDANYVVVKGIGGYSGTRSLPFTLYTSISGAETTKTSLIRNDDANNSPTIITKQKWQEVYEAEGERGLVELANLSFDESEGVISEEEYTLRFSKGFNIADPAVGTATLTIAGAQSEPHYYTGNLDIQFTIVNGLEGAEISVNGTSNAIPYDGSPAVVTKSGVSFVVKVDGVILKQGTDYEIAGYENNDAIGEATVRIKGKGNYAGEAEHTYKVTYPLSRLVVYMETGEGTFVNTAEQTVNYAYKAKEITPQVRLYCPLDIPDSGSIENLIPLSDASYTVAYENNVNAGTASVVIGDAQYFTGDTQRKVTFKINVSSICPATKGAVTYTTTAGSSIDNIRVTYKGSAYTAEDLGIALVDRGVDLISGNSGDYVIYYQGDAENVTKDTENGKPQITFVGVNNYTDSHTIYFVIQQKSLADADIVANDHQPVELIYSGSDVEEALVENINLVFTGAQKLVYGTDYEIKGYYTDALCRNSVVDSDNKKTTPSAQGTYYVKLGGIGNYDGEKIVQVNVGKKDMSSGLRITFVDSDTCPLDASGEPTCVYDGSAHEPAIMVTYGDVELEKGTDYSVTYADNVNASDDTTKASVTVQALDSSNYSGGTSRTFTIAQKSLAQLDTAANTMYYSALEEAYPFTGASVEPAMTVRDSQVGAALVEGYDYTVDYTSEYEALEIKDGAPAHSYAGMTTMTIKGIGNYTGTQEFTYYVGEDISKSYILVNGNSALSTTYNGLEQAPDVNDITVVWKATAEKLDASNEARYDIAYYREGFEKENRVDSDEIIDAATYYIAVVGVPSKGTFALTTEDNSCAYTVYPRSIAPSYILVSGYDGTYYYTGQPIEPKGITVEDTDLPVSTNENDPQRRSVKLKSSADYTISYSNNVSAGKASIIITGSGNYTGSRAAYFNIVSSDTSGNNTWDGTSEGTGSVTNGTTTIAADDIILGYDNSTYSCMMYNGYERVPTVSINGASTSEFIITASNNIRPGTATLLITGKGNNYTGTIVKYYTIKADLSQYGKVNDIEDQTYTGAQVKPNVTVTCGGNLLTQGSDYTLTYANNTNVGKASVIATATADTYYLGSVTGSFNISNTATGMEITGYASSYTYTGYAITPDVIVTMNGRVLTRGTDYTVTYSNNTNVGTASMTVTGIGSFSGSKTIQYVIEKKNIENCITTAVSDYSYTGSSYTPAVTLTDATTGKTLTAGTDYTITYSNNTNPGTASITVTALGKNYSGSKVISFKITSAAVSGLRATKIKNNQLRLSWSDQEYADGYQICNGRNRVIATTTDNSYTVKNLTSCTTYRYKVRSYVENADGTESYGSFSTPVTAKTMLNTPTLTAKSLSRGSVTLTWTRVAKATGYEIYYSTAKNGIYTKLKTVSKSSARKYVDSGLASGEKYYYTIRAYRTVNGVKTYSSYNTIKSATVR